jgi:hypothetical protein
MSGSSWALASVQVSGLNDLLRVDINSLGRLDLTVFIALIIPVYISNTWMRPFDN